MPKKKRTDPISRFEAYMLARWLKERKITADFVDVMHLTPQQVAEKYNVLEQDVLDSIRRKEE